MFSKLFRLLNRVTYFGIQDSDSYLEKFRKRVLNRTFFIIAISCLIFILQILLLEKMQNTLVPIMVGLISAGSLLLTYHDRFGVASVMLTLVFPTLFLGIIIMYGAGLRLDYTISFFIVLVLTLYDDIRSRILNIGYLVLLQLVSFYYTSHYESIHAAHVDFYDSLIVQTFTTLGLFLLVFQFIRTSRRFQDDQTKLNKDLDAKNRQLEQIIQDRTQLDQELQKKTRDLKQSNEFLESYTYITSHDLKTPMRTIVSFSDLLARKLKDREDHDVQDYLKFIRSGVLQFNAIVEGIVENAQSNRSNLHLEKVCCVEVVRQIETKIRFRLEQKQGILEYERLPLINADRRMITTVFEHLIDNGFKYNEAENPRVSIECRVEGGMYEFSVSDNGIGIPSAYRKAIFRMFKKLYVQEEFSGSGVGLALCKKIVELHGGQIWLENGSGPGSVFKFTLPQNGFDHASAAE